MGRARKPAARKPLAPKDSNVEHAHPPHSDATRQMMMDANHREAERHIAAIYAVREAQMHGYLTQLRVALSMLSQEVRALRLDEFVSRFCPDREFIRDPDSDIIELTHKPQGPILPGRPSVATSFEFHTEDSKPFLQNRIQPTPSGFPVSSSAVRDMSQQISVKVAQDKPEDEDFLKFMESFRSSKFYATTPVMNGNSMLGVTPKTTRLPQNGETLLSVNGSPLGVFEEDGVQAIPDERLRRARRRLRASVRLSDI